MAGQFDGKVALVTGGSSGFGRAASRIFARQGAKVVVADLTVEMGLETVKMIEDEGGTATFVKTDVTKEAEVEALVNKAIATYGRLDFAFNNAGIFGAREAITKLTEEQWDQLMNVNLKGVFFCLKHELRYMENHGGGAIVNTSSIAGLLGGSGGGATPYVVAKHGVLGLTKNAGLGYGSAGIRVNAVCPAPADTPLLANQVMAGNAEALQTLGSRMPFGRLITPEEVANAVVWLCSDAASYVNAIALPVDGGLAARWGV